MFNFKFTVMREPDYKEQQFLGFKFKTTSYLHFLLCINYLIFVSLFNFRPIFPFYMSIEV